jgi:hypothetical protein
LFACKEDDAPSKLQLLTNGSSKSWYVSSITGLSECGDTDMMKDNTWTFYSDNTFTYDHGTVTGSGDCEDLVNFTGTWVFEDEETHIRIVGLYNTDDPEDTFHQEFLYGRIVELTAEKLVLDADGSQGTLIPK